MSHRYVYAIAIFHIYTFDFQHSKVEFLGGDKPVEELKSFEEESAE
jgi:hypothetical protein